MKRLILLSIVTISLYSCSTEIIEPSPATDKAEETKDEALEVIFNGL